MKKRIISACLIITLLLGLGACSREPVNRDHENTPVNTVDTATLFDGIALENGCVSELYGEISWPQSAKTYKRSGDFVENADEIAALMLGEGFTKKEAGVHLLYESDDFDLRINGTTARLWRKSDKTEAIVYAVPYTSNDFPTQDHQRAGISKDDYGTEDLSFMTMAEAIVEVNAKLRAFGIGTITVAQGYSLDHETLMNNKNKYITYLREYGIDTEESRARYQALEAVEFGPEDEYYFFVCKLTIDDIDVLHTLNVQTEQDIFVPEIYCIYGKDGFLRLDLRNVPCSLESAGEEAAPISAQEAAQIIAPVIPERFPDQHLFQIKFCYTYYNDKRTVNRPLHPIWLFVTRRDKPDVLKDGSTVREYFYYAVDAFTGRIVSKP